MPAAAARNRAAPWRPERDRRLVPGATPPPAGGYAVAGGGLAFVGTPATLADEMEEWLETRDSDVPQAESRPRRAALGPGSKGRQGLKLACRFVDARIGKLENPPVLHSLSLA